MKSILTRETNIKATLICDSINKQGIRITTMELEYPRFIHSEFMTHRMFSRNASSSRAVPTMKAIEQVESNMATPLYWGANQSGMQAGGELPSIGPVKEHWRLAFESAKHRASILNDWKLHKQHTARLIEPFQMIKVLVTATEWDNFYNLRLHPDAQPEIMRLAYEMYKAQEASEPVMLKAGEWHLPYVNTGWNGKGDICYFDENFAVINLEQAIRISASCCAQTSYRKNDVSLEKADAIFERLVQADVLHSSPFEHLATPIRDQSMNINGFDYGITHGDLNGGLWSGNLRGWIQYRHTLPSNTCHKFDFNKRMELFK